MPETIKRAVTGFSGIRLAKVTEDTGTGYKSEGVSIELLASGKMTRTAKEKKQDIYYEDGLYAQVAEMTGEEVEIRLGEITFEQLQDLGAGVFEPLTNRFEGRFTVDPGKYSLRCRADTVSKRPYYFLWRVFELNSIRYDNFESMGDSISVCEVIISGILKKPAMESVREYAMIRLTEDRSNQAECDSFCKDGETFPKAG